MADGVQGFSMQGEEEEKKEEIWLLDQGLLTSSPSTPSPLPTLAHIFTPANNTLPLTSFINPSLNPPSFPPFDSLTSLLPASPLNPHPLPPPTPPPTHAKHKHLLEPKWPIAWEYTNTVSELSIYHVSQRPKSV